MTEVVKFEGVSKNYGKIAALNNVSFNISPGNITALIGNNGSGKSTALHLICNLISADAGSLHVFEKKVSPGYVSYKQRIGVILNKETLIEGFTAKEYLTFVCQFQRVSKSEIDLRIKDIIQFLSIKDPHLKIKQLSLGNKAKVALAGALIHNPDLLILDEPLANLDISTTADVVDLFKNLKKTILITSHNLDLITDLCDRFIVLGNGIKVADLYKNEFANLDALKTKVKDLLMTHTSKNDLKWLQQ